MPVDEKVRKRMVVEEVGVAEENQTGNSGVAQPVEEIKEKVEELHDITEDISESVAKSEDIQEDLAKAIDDSEPVVTTETPSAEPEKTSEGFSQEAFAPINNTPSGTNPLFVIIPGIFLLGALLGGIYFYQKRIVNQPTITPEPTATELNNPSAVPSAQPSLTVDLTKYPINVMNGSGTPGEASKVKDILTSGGFTVSATGNASSYGFTKTVIKTKADVPATFVSQLSALVSKSYVLDTNQSLATSSADEVQIIVGTTKSK